MTTKIHKGFTGQLFPAFQKEVVRFVLSIDFHDAQVGKHPALLDCYSELLLSGTRKKNRHTLLEEIDALGMHLSITQNNQYIHIDVEILDEVLPKALSLLSEILLNSLLSVSEYARVRTLVGERYREEEDNGSLRAHTLFLHTLHPKTSRYHRSLLRNKKQDLKQLSRKDVLDLHRELPYCPWYLSATATKSSQKKLVNTLGKLHGGVEKKTKEVAYKPSSAKECIEHIPHKENIEIRIGGRMPAHTNPEAIAFSFGMAVLGYPGMENRLMNTVREEEGLTYVCYVYSDHGKYEPGAWYVHTFFATKDLKKGMASVMRQLKLIREKGISEHELKTFKMMLKNQFVLAHESDRRRITLHHEALLRGLSVEDLHAEAKHIEKLTRKEVNSALKKYVDLKNLVVTKVGDI